MLAFIGEYDLWVRVEEGGWFLTEGGKEQCAEKNSFNYFANQIEKLK